MRKLILSILISVVSWAAFAANPRWAALKETPIPARADLDVRWDTPANFGVGSNVPTNVWPAEVWIYRLLPRKFAPETISNLMVMCSFTEKDRVEEDANGAVFRSPDGSRSLSISCSLASVRYESPELNYGPTNLAQGVPAMADLPSLTTNFVSMIGVPFSEICKGTNGLPDFNFSEPYTWYYLTNTTVTNIPFRAVVFSRCVDGARVIGGAGHCGLKFGEHGKVALIHFSWPGLESKRSAVAFRPEKIVRLIREGKAYQGMVPSDVGYINWPTVKSVTIKQAWPCYFGDSSTLYPFMALWTTIDTGNGSFDAGIECPIIDETKP